MFDVTKSKLYGQIMAACANFFGLGEAATEAEIHDALEGEVALAAQIQAARNEAAAETAAQFTVIQAQLTALTAEADVQRTELAALRTEMESKNARIAEMQTEAASFLAQIDALKAQHKTEINTLAGQLSAMKAGQLLQQDEGSDTHPAAAGGQSSSPAVIQSAALSKLIAKSRLN